MSKQPEIISLALNSWPRATVAKGCSCSSVLIQNLKFGKQILLTYIQPDFFVSLWCRFGSSSTQAVLNWMDFPTLSFPCALHTNSLQKKNKKCRGPILLCQLKGSRSFWKLDCVHATMRAKKKSKWGMQRKSHKVKTWMSCFCSLLTTAVFADVLL